MRAFRQGLSICAAGALVACFGASPVHAADSNEPNETPATATGFLAGGQTYTAEIDRLSSEVTGNTIEDRDWYRFYVERAVPLEITYTQAYRELDCYAPQLVLFDETGEKVLGSVHPVGEGTGTLKYSVPAAGTFLIRVQPYYVRTCQPDKSAYSFSIAPAAAIGVPPDKPAEQPVMPAEVEPGSPVVPSGGGSSGGGSTGGGPTGSGSGVGTAPPGTPRGLRNPGLRLSAASLRRGVLRAEGVLRTSASVKRLRLVVERRVGRRVFRTAFTARRSGNDGWVAAKRLPASMRRARTVRLRVSFVQGGGFGARRVATRTVKAR